MRKIITILVVLISVIGCSEEQYAKKRFQEYIETIDFKYPENLKYIVVIPNNGCPGCISHIEDFYVKNNDNESLGFIITNIISMKILKMKLDINIENTYLDTNNEAIGCYPKDKQIYPCFLKVKKGKIMDIYYQSMEEDGLAILKKEMNL